MSHDQARIIPIESELELTRAHPIIVQLRPHLDLAAFIAQARRQMAGGWRMVGVELGPVFTAVTGYRVTEFLAWGKVLYVDDLVTAAEVRSQGHGRMLFQWLVNQARQQDCDQLHLDSGVQRFGAHRFYLRERMDITSHHFALKLDRN